MRAGVIEGIDFAIDIKKGDFASIGNYYNDAFAWRDIFNVGEFQNPWSPPITPEALSAK